MQPLDIMISSFIITGKMRISAQSDVGTSLDVMRTLWISIYDAEIVNPYLAQLNVHVPFLLVNSNQMSFGME
jgi:hypothetical protein